MNNDIDPKRNSAGGKQEPGSLRSTDPVYLYKDSGIQEHHGNIPLWLKGVVLVLLIWGIYYLVAYWAPPPV